MRPRAIGNVTAPLASVAGESAVTEMPLLARNWLVAAEGVTVVVPPVTFTFVAACAPAAPTAMKHSAAIAATSSARGRVVREFTESPPRRIVEVGFQPLNPSRRAE